MKIKSIQFAVPIRLGTVTNEKSLNTSIRGYEKYNIRYDVDRGIYIIQVPGKDKVIVHPANVAFAVIEESDERVERVETREVEKTRGSAESTRKKRGRPAVRQTT